MFSSTSVSVVIPTYDRADRLARALTSVWRQTCPPGEVIVVDDGSTDGTGDLVRRNFPEACYVRQDHRGVSAARNRGLREAGGDWIAFLDSDDEWLPTKLECQLDRLRLEPEYRICHTDEIWIRSGRRVNPRKKHEKFGGAIFAKCLPLCVISPSAALVHRSVFDEVGTFDEALPACEDYDLWLRVTAKYPVLYLSEPLIVKYGGHADQLSRRYWGMDRFRIRSLEKLLLSEDLAPSDRRAATRALMKKIEIYTGGSRKRGKWGEVAQYEKKRRRLRALGGVS